MEENEMLEQTNETENVETLTTEENVDGIELTDTSNAEKIEDTEPVEGKEEVKMFTQEEVNEMLKRRLDRENRKHQKELAKYKDVENVLQTTIGGNDIGEIGHNLREAYKEQGFEIPEPVNNGLSDRQIEILAKGEAEDIIEDGYDAMVEEANRLADKKYENLTKKEQIVFGMLAEKLTAQKDEKTLAKLGVKEDLLKNEEFKTFRNKFNKNTPLEDIYSLYEKMQPKKEKPAKMGSMKTTTQEPTVKDFYTYEESLQFTRDDFNKNPELFKAVQNSMTKW